MLISSYSFRPTTALKQDTPQRVIPARTFRNILSPSKTASLYSKDHDCTTINEEHTYIKITSRFLLSMFRFYVSYGLGCTTTRQITWANGAQSHCGSLCQSAHAALSPTLCDNTFTVSQTHLINRPYNELSPIKQNLVKRCLRLSSNNIETLNDQDQKQRKSFLDQHQHPSFQQSKAGAFIFNSIGEMRNVTFEGPTAGNRVDCHLESILRSLEDELANKCTNQQIDPKTALHELYLQYKVSLETLESRLMQALEVMHLLQEAEKAMVEQQQLLSTTMLNSTGNLQNGIALYKRALENYNVHYNSWVSLKGQGVPHDHHQQITNALNLSHPRYTVNKVILPLLTDPMLCYVLQNQFKLLNQFRLKNPQLPNWIDMSTSIQLRQEEVKNQQHIINLEFDNIYALAKMEFFSKNMRETFKSPDRSAIAMTLIDRIESPIVPSKRKRTRLFSEGNLNKTPKKRSK